MGCRVYGQGTLGLGGLYRRVPMRRQPLRRYISRMNTASLRSPNSRVEAGTRLRTRHQYDIGMARHPLAPSAATLQLGFAVPNLVISEMR